MAFSMVWVRSLRKMEQYCVGISKMVNKLETVLMNADDEYGIANIQWIMAELRNSNVLQKSILSSKWQKGDKDVADPILLSSNATTVNMTYASALEELVKPLFKIAYPNKEEFNTNLAMLINAASKNQLKELAGRSDAWKYFGQALPDKNGRNPSLRNCIEQVLDSIFEMNPSPLPAPPPPPVAFVQRRR